MLPILLNIIIIHVISAISSIAGYKILFDNNWFILGIVGIIELTKYNCTIILSKHMLQKSKFNIFNWLIILALIISVFLSSLGIYSSTAYLFNAKLMEINKFSLSYNKIDLEKENIINNINRLEQENKTIESENQLLWNNITNNENLINKLYQDTSKDWTKSIWDYKKQNENYKKILNTNKIEIDSTNNKIEKLNNKINNINENFFSVKNDENISKNISVFINISKFLHVNLNSFINFLIWLIIIIIDPLGILFVHIYNNKLYKITKDINNKNIDTNINIKNQSKIDFLDDDISSSKNNNILDNIDNNSNNENLINEKENYNINDNINNENLISILKNNSDNKSSQTTEQIITFN